MKRAGSKRAAAALAGYAPLLADLKARVRTAQLRAAAAANRELLLLYWQIGHLIAQRQAAAGWGAGIIPRLAADLHREFPDLQGFSERNLKYMVRFATEYGDPAIVQPAVAQLKDGEKAPTAPAPVARSQIVQPAAAQLTEGGDLIGQPLLANLPWAHHVALLDRVKDRRARIWYMQQAVAHGWSRAVLILQIENRAHARAGKAVTNFAQTLPPPQSDLAAQALKDPYVFDFLLLDATAREREIETALVDHVTKLLLELGAGFAFVGRQVPLEVANKDYFLDLLFYHTRLHCYVVVELKAGEFEPEYAGKLNFYLSAVDDLMRQPEDKPTIGLLLCRSKDKIEVEYALRDVKKPIGVAQWKTKLVDSLPKNLRGTLPSVAQLERELAKS